VRQRSETPNVQRKSRGKEVFVSEGSAIIDEIPGEVGEPAIRSRRIVGKAGEREERHQGFGLKDQAQRRAKNGFWYARVEG